MVFLRGWWYASLLLLVLTAGCRGGAAGRAAALPQPTNLGQWLAIGLFVLAVWWVAMKITRG